MAMVVDEFSRIRAVPLREAVQDWKREKRRRRARTGPEMVAGRREMRGDEAGVAGVGGMGMVAAAVAAACKLTSMVAEAWDRQTGWLRVVGSGFGCESGIYGWYVEELKVRGGGCG